MAVLNKHCHAKANESSIVFLLFLKVYDGGCVVGQYVYLVFWLIVVLLWFLFFFLGRLVDFLVVLIRCNLFLR